MAAVTPQPPPQPAVLPSTIVDYDGGVQKGRKGVRDIDNVLYHERDEYHCSKEGRNFNLVLLYHPNSDNEDDEAEGEQHSNNTATLTHVVIRGPVTCTSPIATGIIFTSLDKPNVTAYSSKYDDMTRQQFDALSDEQKRADGVLAYFAAAEPNTLEIAITLSAWRECRYVHVKLISAAPEDGVEEVNIDLERVALVGFPTEETLAVTPSAIAADILRQLELLDDAWSALTEKHYATIKKRPACILFLADTTQPDTIAARDCVQAIADSGYQPALRFFHLNVNDTAADPRYIDYLGSLTDVDMDELKQAAAESGSGVRRARLIITNTRDQNNKHISLRGGWGVKYIRQRWRACMARSVRRGQPAAIPQVTAATSQRRGSQTSSRAAADGEHVG